MRLHRLSITAFGPYADTAEIDFDELNDAGIFLLTGPTGAGKTSILDAVCFALYGVVPGVRDTKTLRSHHAGPGVRPEVVLEATIGDRRLRVRRSPEWQRPKKRGNGTTKENACATLVELLDGQERLLSSRVAEVGHELGIALGMSSEQFMQVVMLPQGQFQTFLRATSDERQDVLQKLFRTERFERIEHWVRDRTRELCLRSEQGERRVAQLVATLAHRVGGEPPEPLRTAPLGDVGTSARGWALELLTAARESHAAAATREERAQSALAAAEVALVRAERAAADAECRRLAGAELDALDATAPEATEQEEQLRRHQRGCQVRPYLAPLTELGRTAERCRSRSEAATASLTEVSAVVPVEAADPATLRAVLVDLTTRTAELRAAVPLESTLAEGARRLRTADAELARWHERIPELAARADQLPARLRTLEAELDALKARAAQLPSAADAAEDAGRRHAAAAALPAAAQGHTELADRSRAARDRAADAREHHLDVLGRRLAGMAAELAGALEAGDSCPVCGSEEHPAPATPVADAVTEGDQKQAQAEHDRLQREAEALAAGVEESAARLHELERSSGGLTPTEAAEGAAAARSALTDAEEAVLGLPRVEQQRTRLLAEEREVARLLQEAQGAHGALAAEVASLRAVGEETAATLHAVKDGAAAPLTDLVAQHERLLVRVQEVIDAVDEHERARDRLAEAAVVAEASARDHGFGSAEEAADALLPEPVVGRLQQQLEDRRQRRRAAQAVLELDVPGAPDALGAVDVAAARAELDRAKAALRVAAVETGTAEAAARALTGLAASLDDALEEWEPAREEHETAERISKLVRGMGHDNQLQMRLSSYVLATRLDQVLDAANERLCEMRDQRYTLRRTGRARGGSRAGLGLELLDAWTGEARAPSTLSGGETFVVSLALALGLADVVSHESGGLRVDTLFVDEGFGMLDQDTLDDVMDRIDALRAGGRTVGVVSHVTELRGRIPTQLHVERGRKGSSVAVRTLVA